MSDEKSIHDLSVEAAALSLAVFSAKWASIEQHAFLWQARQALRRAVFALEMAASIDEEVEK